MEQQNLRWWLVIIALVTLSLGYIGLPIPNKPGADSLGFLRDRKINLGLDLQGGSEIRVEFDLDKAEAGVADLKENRAKLVEAIAHAHETLSRRINLHGVKEPRIQIYGETQILIQLPGQDRLEMERVKKIIYGSGKLEFCMVDSNQNDLNVPVPGTRVLQREEKRGDSEPGATTQVRVRIPAPITGAEVSDASASFEDEGWQVNLRFHPKGARLFGTLTSQNVGKPFAIILDGKVVSDPEIKQAITDGSCRITGNFDEQRAKDLATVLKSGSLAAPLKLAGENYVGPSLGQDSIRRGVWAGIFAVAAVFLFMLIYYRKIGMVANVAMFANVMMLLGILALFGATLTLPGIAAIVLTLGMAVDANILINERIREESAKGKSPLQAFDAGYDRAFLTIFDSNITTLFAGIILYYVGSGPIQGFAVALSVGIVTTMITALWVGKIITRYMLLGGSFAEFRMMKLFDKPSFVFSAKGRLAFLCSFTFIAAGLGFVVWRGEKILSIDFRGGTIMNLQFNGPTDIDTVRNGVRDIKDPAGHSTYGDAEVQSVYMTAGAGEQAASNIFQVRVGESDSDALKGALAKQFAGKVPSAPIVEMDPITTPGKYQGALQLRIGLSEEMDRGVFQDKLRQAIKSVASDPPPMVIEPRQGSSKEFVVAIKSDASQSEVIEAIKKAKAELKLAPDPFPFVSSIGASVAKEMKSKAAQALLFSWIAMIVYLAFRFEFIYGVAAVIALIHDVLFTLGVVSVVSWLLPKTLGIDLDLGLSAVAAYLTIVGYSVNDTIVIFDRIRENLKDMKRDMFSVVMDASVNQTLSRTFLTSFTVFLTAIVLFLLTARSGGGIASFAFPLIVGVIVGTYSSVFIASPVVMWWRGNRPAVS